MNGFDDGATALKELKKMCLGGQGMENLEGLLTGLYAIEGNEFDQGARELTTHHEGLVRKINDIVFLKNMSVKDFMDVIFKLHLLRCLRTTRLVHSYGNVLSVSHSKEGTTYEDLIKEVVRISYVLNSSSGNGAEDPNQSQDPTTSGVYYAGKNRRAGGPGTRKY